MNHETAWATYEANVQAYRGSFNSTQSILLAFGALVYSQSNTNIFTLICAISLIQIWWIWFRVIRSRIFIVDYHKIFIDQKYITPSPEDKIGEKEYVKNSAARKKFNEDAKMDTNWRQSRKKMDIYLPIMYTVLWLIMLFDLWHC